MDMNTAPYPKLNFVGADWGTIAEWLRNDLQEKYRMLASVNCSADETQQLRGRILLLEQMLEWPRLAATLSTQGVYNVG